MDELVIIRSNWPANCVYSDLSDDDKTAQWLDLVKLGCSVKVGSVRMGICKKEFVARGFLIIVVSALLSMSFAISRHFVPQGLRQVITINHQIRRVLLRAERENLRSGVVIQKVPLMMNPPQELTELFRPFESVV